MSAPTGYVVFLEQLYQSEFSCLVPMPLNARHYFGAFIDGEDVGHRVALLWDWRDCRKRRIHSTEAVNCSNAHSAERRCAIHGSGSFQPSLDATLTVPAVIR
jgi:hypothetical protein